MMIREIFVAFIIAFAIYGVYCVIVLIAGAFCKKKFRVAVDMSEKKDAEDLDVYLSAKRAEAIFDGKRHLCTPPVILADKETDITVLHTLKNNYGLDIYIKMEDIGDAETGESDSERDC